MLLVVLVSFGQAYLAKSLRRGLMTMGSCDIFYCSKRPGAARSSLNPKKTFSELRLSVHIFAKMITKNRNKLDGFQSKPRLLPHHVVPAGTLPRS
ncbi:hypothetical protein AVEN_3207-1 [Araneus ventricosus]|uniref:Uncharacterized protein n=1 Tax=Araneus ventricosus TaxID=182803 RepID=A0A4Y2M7Q8_ARAVE|nr:hypothetical protein AVEN_3207-1 [Araneus ventricosus]